MNSNMLGGQWKQIKGEIRTAWSQITGDELEQSRGQFMSITGLIQEKYGHEKEEVVKKLQSIFHKFGQTTEDIKAELKN
jgi:uncharacterized protein YjbJ (UPF0337 family)